VDQVLTAIPLEQRHLFFLRLRPSALAFGPELLNEAAGLLRRPGARTRPCRRTAHPGRPGSPLFPPVLKAAAQRPAAGGGLIQGVVRDGAFLALELILLHGPAVMAINYEQETDGGMLLFAGMDPVGGECGHAGGAGEIPPGRAL